VTHVLHVYLSVSPPRNVRLRAATHCQSQLHAASFLSTRLPLWVRRVTRVDDGIQKKIITCALPAQFAARKRCVQKCRRRSTERPALEQANLLVHISSHKPCMHAVWTYTKTIYRLVHAPNSPQCACTAEFMESAVQLSTSSPVGSLSRSRLG